MEDFWVTEANQGFGLTVRVTETLCEKRSQFQKIGVYQTKNLGRMLMLDGIIQLTDFDEFAYHEMMVNLPLFAHENPRRLLVIGGGDGGVLREAGKHPELEVMDICEIDEKVIETSKKYFPSIACGFDDPRVKVHIADGSEFVKDKAGYYDVIIVDSTDPGGPGTPLFGEQFYRDMKKALRPGGVIGTQAESPFLLPDIVKRLYKTSRQVFRSVGYAGFFVPTYPTGNIGECVAGDDDVTHPKRPVPPELAKQLRYYNEKVHEAAFANPSFVTRLLG